MQKGRPAANIFSRSKIQHSNAFGRKGNSKQATKQENKTPARMSDSPRLASKIMTFSSVSDRFRGILPPGYTKQSLSTDFISQSRVMDHCKPFRNLKADEKYKRVTNFLCAVLIRIPHCAIFLLSKHSTFSLQDRIWFTALQMQWARSGS